MATADGGPHPLILRRVARRPRRPPAPLDAALLFLLLLLAPARLRAEPPLGAEIVIDPLASGLPPVSGLTHAGDDRLFLVTLDGRVLVYRDGEVVAEPLLDLRDRVGSGGERGLLSVAFHPRHAANGLLFAAYSDPDSHLVIARYRLAPTGERVEPGSEAVLLRIQAYGFGHFSGQLQFGPDGYLYASVGTSPLVGDAKCSGQRLDVLRGKLLRLDVDTGAERPPHYTAPATNPFAGGVAPEIWAYGIRNAWRFSFDRGTGDLFFADVGERRREEVNRQPAASPGGENYGWARMEGTHCTDLVTPCAVPVPPCGDPSLTAPILEHPHTNGFCAIIGGYVYRGAELPELDGRYVYGDYCTGRLFAAAPGSEGWSSEDLGLAIPGLSTLGESASGEIHLATADGVLARLARWPGAAADGLCLPAVDRLCLGDGGRYRVTARWGDAGGRSGHAAAVPLTRDAGYFWFFAPENVELVAKVVDGCAAGLPAVWFFAAGLTDLAIDLELLDVRTGWRRRYQTPLGVPFPPIQEVPALPCS